MGVLIGVLAASVPVRAWATDPVWGTDVGFMLSTVVKGHSDGGPIVGGHFGFDGENVGLGVRGDVATNLGRLELFLGPYLNVEGRFGGLGANLVVEGGVHPVLNAGTSFFEDGNSDTAYLPFVGGRLRFASLPQRHLVAVGFSVFAKRDLATQQVTATLTDLCLALCDTSMPYKSTFEVGGTTVGMAVTIEFRPRRRTRPSPSPSSEPSDP
jgi:hypothetical protein